MILVIFDSHNFVQNYILQIQKKLAIIKKFFNSLTVTIF